MGRRQTERLARSKLDLDVWTQKGRVDYVHAEGAPYIAMRTIVTRSARPPRRDWRGGRADERVDSKFRERREED